MEQFEISNAPTIPQLIAPPPVLYLGTFGLALLAEQAIPMTFATGILGTFLGPGLTLAGLLLAYYAFTTLRYAGTSGDPRRATSALVIHGPFAYSRNPIYLAMTMMYFGLAVYSQSIWPLAFLPVLGITMHRGVIVREEAYLNQRFGYTYAAYCLSVRRWL